MDHETGLQSYVVTYQRLKKMIFDVSLFNTQHYKVRIKDKGSNPGKRLAPSLQLAVVAIEKGTFGSPLTTVSQLTKQYIYIYIYISSSHLVVPPARISLSLSLHPSLSFIASSRSSWLHPVSSQSCCM